MLAVAPFKRRVSRVRKQGRKVVDFMMSAIVDATGAEVLIPLGAANMRKLSR